MTTDRVYLLDASVYIFRAYYSVPDQFSDRQGNLVNAVYGFASTLCTLVEQARPQQLAVAFDESQKDSFRNEIYPDYKANREPAPEQLKRQFALCRRVAEALGISCFSDPRYEADDLIGTLASHKRLAGHKLTIVSADKDLAQLLTSGDFLWDIGKRKEDLEGIKKRFGVRADQVVDFLALAGDSVDNIPGIPGVGQKTAVALLNHFDSLTELLRRVDEISYLRIRGAKSVHRKVKEGSQSALLSRRLAQIDQQATAIGEDVNLRWQGPDMEQVTRLFDELGFGRGLHRRIANLPTNR